MKSQTSRQTERGNHPIAALARIHPTAPHAQQTGRSLTDEERYHRSVASLRVLEAMLVQAANSGQAPNEKELDSGSTVIAAALDTFEELEILELVGDRDSALVLIAEALEATGSSVEG